MASWKQFEGYYSLMDLTVEVKIVNGQLTTIFPGVPPGFEIVMQPLDEPNRFRMSGGPAAGATAVFQVDEGGQVTGFIVGGEHDFTRQATPPPEPDYPTGQGLLAPELELNGEKETAFAGLLTEMLYLRDGRLLDYQLPYPKHEFLQYVAEKDEVIFHGSGKPDITEFHTRRTSMELNDKSGRGNVQGVYGTHDGLWPLFFAVVDRDKITGSIRNGFSTFQNAQGHEIRVYHFSINKDWLAAQPWRTGTLYLLPRETFRRMPASLEGGESNEWVSEVSVKPLARLTIEPEDFPFLDQIGGHDDSELIQLGEMGKQITTAVSEAAFSPGKITMKMDYSIELGRLFLQFVPLAQKFIPTARFTLRFQPENEVWYEFEGPPAVLQVMKDQIEEHLS